MSENKPIDFYFEFASPYGYFTSLAIGDLAAKYGRTVNWRPFALGAVFKITNSAPNMTIPMKGEYLYRDIERCAKLMGAEYKVPKVSPMNSMAAMRAFYWLSDTDASQAVPFAKAIYREHWGRGRDLGPVEAVAEVASELGIDGDALTAATQDPAIKERLKKETQTAIDRGAFGSPFIFVDEEAFWGNDRLDQVEHLLRTGGF